MIGATIRSLLDQTFADFELLVRDDDGEDGVEDVVRGLADARVRYHRNPQRLRMPGNLNSGIRDTVGEYVLVCHDHDLYDPKLVARMVETLDAQPSALFVHCGAVGIDESGRTVENWVQDLPELTHGERWVHRMLENFASPVCADSMARRTAHERFGLYDPDYGFVADVEMWMRLSHAGDVRLPRGAADPAARAPRPITSHRRELAADRADPAHPAPLSPRGIPRLVRPCGRLRAMLRTGADAAASLSRNVVRGEQESKRRGPRLTSASGAVFARLRLGDLDLRPQPGTDSVELLPEHPRLIDARIGASTR